MYYYLANNFYFIFQAHIILVIHFVKPIKNTFTIIKPIINLNILVNLMKIYLKFLQYDKC